MPQAVWNGTVLAESENCPIVDGNTYFPADALNKDYFVESPTTSMCGWKGLAHYYTIQVDGDSNRDAAWYYPETKPEANHIKDHIAFWKGVEIKD